jgi:dethiobiotin synthetase
VSRLLIVTATDSGVGKTVTSAALAVVAADAGLRVGMVKLAQTGVGPAQLGDADVVRRLAGRSLRHGGTHELVRYPAPLSPEAAARDSRRPALSIESAEDALADLVDALDLLIVEGSGGLLVRFDPSGWTVADLAGRLSAPVVVVTSADHGTLNHTALTLEAVAHRELDLLGVVIGSWSSTPDLTARSNAVDLDVVTHNGVVGWLPPGAAEMDTETFAAVAHESGLPGLLSRWR